MAYFRDYEIHLLFLLLVKFHGSGKCEIYSPEQRILLWFFNYHVPFKLRHRKRRPFISERDFRQNDFQTSRWLSTVFVLQNLDMMLGSLSRDK